jgi:predicted nucleic acid-binding protein
VQQVALLDVNVLIALMDPLHVHHEPCHHWFAARGTTPWASCAITQNGVLRILGHPRYPNSPGSPGVVGEILQALVAHPQHQFWDISPSLLSQAHVNTQLLLDSAQITDTYLLGTGTLPSASLLAMGAPENAPAIPTIVLTDDTDSSNGSAQVLPYNLIRLYVTAPESVSVLNDHDDWMYGLVVHEYAHILHLDNITGLAAHNNFLIIFGSRQILVYTGANNPAGTSPVTFLLADSVGGIGCIARDSIQQTGKDVLFLSNSGVRSFARTIIEKSLPVGDLSKNVRNDLIQIVNGEDKKNIKSVYSETKAFYLLTLPSVSEVYCFDTRGQLQDGSFRVTRWDSIAPTSLLSRRNGDVLVGKNGFVCKYGTYQDHTSAYRLMYFTNHADLGNQNVTSLLKRIKVVVIGGSNQAVTVKFGFDFAANYQAVNVFIPLQGTSEYGVAEYGANGSPVAEYSDGVALQTLSVPASGSGKIVQTGYESNINGSPLSIQRIEIQSKDGKIA